MIVDIHNHILPEMDDGPDNMDQAVNMAKAAADHGISTIIATPHHRNGQFICSPSEIINKVNKLNALLRERRINVQILPGMEIHLYPEICTDLIKEIPDSLTLADNHQYILVELPYSYYPGFTDTLLYELQLEGFIPVLAHPERNSVIRRRPNLLYQLIKRGILVQITAGSITGTFGRKIQKFAEKLLKHHLVHFIASDAHNNSSRPFELLYAYNYIAETYSAAYSDYLKENAACIVNGSEFNINTPKKLRRKNKLLSFFVK
ncbi:tyrosine-protein phosphatase [Bacillus sp. SG-1]|uniref:tyrosine-protein phosphatase n=1 Tax=Bacillus sp. SG-1 TaxID=161544 RepID=UPI00015432AA|nr:CpsB/CapC family capsule biosynthesis tyrosine phosphatase [Bacillus sp. SG-1]EDL65254.1 phosphotyrosine-protein phosphatase (capsular polysaccharide biosynthesis) [Bacillus sp. SG-1]